MAMLLSSTVVTLLSIASNTANVIAAEEHMEVVGHRRSFLDLRGNARIQLASTGREECTCTIAQKKILTDCLKHFFSKFDITMVDDKLPPYQRTSKIIEDANPCSAFNELRSCDASVQTDCVCQDTYMEMASTFGDGLLYLTDYIDMIYNCTEQSHEAEKCYESVRRSSKWETVAACTTTADNLLKFSCSYVKLFMDCVHQPIASVCSGKGFEAYCTTEIFPLKAYQLINTTCYKELEDICSGISNTLPFNVFLISTTLLLIAKVVLL